MSNYSRLHLLQRGSNACQLTEHEITESKVILGHYVIFPSNKAGSSNYNTLFFAEDIRTSRKHKKCTTKK